MVRFFGQQYLMASPFYINHVVPHPLDYKSAFEYIDLQSFYRQTRGDEVYQMTGRSLFSKYLNCKITLKFTQNDATIVTPTTMEVIHGFITKPLALNNTAITYSPPDLSIAGRALHDRSK